MIDKLCPRCGKPSTTVMCQSCGYTPGGSRSGSARALSPDTHALGSPLPQPAAVQHGQAVVPCPSCGIYMTSDRCHACGWKRVPSGPRPVLPAGVAPEAAFHAHPAERSVSLEELEEDRPRRRISSAHETIAKAEDAQPHVAIPGGHPPPPLKLSPGGRPLPPPPSPDESLPKTVNLSEIGLPSELSEDVPSEWPRRLAIGLGVTVVVLLAVGFMFRRMGGHVPPPREAYILPTELTLPPTIGSSDLLAAINVLDTIASDVQRRLVNDDDVNKKALATVLIRLDTVDKQLQSLRPQLNAEERNIAGAVLGASSQVRALVVSFETPSPDLDGKYVVLARRDLEQARGLLGGQTRKVKLSGQ